MRTPVPELYVPVIEAVFANDSVSWPLTKPEVILTIALWRLPPSGSAAVIVELTGVPAAPLS